MRTASEFASSHLFISPEVNPPDDSSCPRRNPGNFVGLPDVGVNLPVYVFNSFTFMTGCPLESWTEIRFISRNDFGSRNRTVGLPSLRMSAFAS